MSGESLYVIACEMLETTNVYNKSVSEIKFSKHGREDDEVSLLDLVKKQCAKYNHRYRGKSDENLKRAYTAISIAMVNYLEEYPVVFSFKQKTRTNFKEWLKRILKTFSIAGQDIPADLKKSETDTGIAMLKLLHSRDGVTYDEISEELDIGARAIQKNLIKLSPSLYSEPIKEDSPYIPFRVGGQPLLSEITLVEEKEKRASEKRFRTLNSVHPLVLQENIMQLATLLKALCNQYYGCSDELSVLIAIDIWSQMSDYARNKIKKHYAFDNPDLADFIEMLDDECPDDHVCAYQTEKDLIRDIEMPVDDALPYLTKVRGRKAIIILKTGECIRVKELHQTCTNDGSDAYQARNDEGNLISFTKGQVEEVILN